MVTGYGSEAPKTGRNRAILWDYDYILDKSDSECLYCLSERTAQLLIALCPSIQWHTRYTSEIDTEPDQDKLNTWYAQAVGELMSDCGTTSGINFLVQANIETQFNVWAGDTPTQINPSVPDTTFDTNSTDDPTQAGQTIDALCYACGTFVDYTCEAWKTANAETVTLIDIVAGIASVVAAVAAIVLTAGAATPLVYGLLAAVLYAGGSILTLMTDLQANNLTARHEVKCALFAALQGQTISQANFKTACDGLTLTGDAAAIASVIAFIQDGEATNANKVYTAFVNMLGDARRSALAGLVPECDCCTTPDLFWDWFNNVDDLTGWSVISTSDFPVAQSDTLNDAAGSYYAELHANADGMGHAFVFPAGNGFLTGHQATGMQYDVDSGGCRLKSFSVRGNNGDTSATNSKLWVHTSAGWHYVTLLDFTAVTTVTITLTVAVDEPDVDKIAIINYSGGNMYMAQLRLTWG